MSRITVETLSNPSAVSVPDQNFGNGVIGPSQADMDFFNSLKSETIKFSDQPILLDRKSSGIADFLGSLVDKIPGKGRIAVASPVLASVAIVACGGSEPTNTSDGPTPAISRATQATVAGATQSTESSTPTVVETESPASTPTATENNPYGIAPAFENPNDPNDTSTVVYKVNAALQISGAIPFGDMGIFKQKLDSCNEINVQFDESRGEKYDLTVVSSLGQVYQALAQMYTENPAPQIKDAMDSVESFTFGTNGKIEDLNDREQLTISYGTPPTLAGYKERLHDSYFVPLQ